MIAKMALTNPLAIILLLPKNDENTKVLLLLKAESNKFTLPFQGMKLNDNDVSKNANKKFNDEKTKRSVEKMKNVVVKAKNGGEKKKLGGEKKSFENVKKKKSAAVIK